MSQHKDAVNLITATHAARVCGKSPMGGDALRAMRIPNDRAARQAMQQARKSALRKADNVIGFIERMGYDVEDWQRPMLRQLYANQPNEAKRARLHALFGTPA